MMDRLRFLLAVMLISIAAACSSNTEQPVCDETDPEAFCAWDFSLTSLDGTEYTLSEMRGGWVLINFWATTCGPCVEEMPVLQEITDRHEELTILAINQREHADAVEKFRDELGLRFPLLMNPDDTTLINYSVIGLPQTIVVDPTGEVVWRQFGPVELDSFGEQMAMMIREYAATS